MAARRIPWNKVKYHKEIYLFILPTAVMVGLFAYYPASSGLIHSLYRWNGADIEEYRGLSNYWDLLMEGRFWHSFKIVFLLGLVNVLKMIPALAVAVLIHRVRSDRMQYLYRVLFVVPMVIPGIVIILLWRFFFEPTVGILNTALRSTGLLSVLAAVDHWFGWGVFTHPQVGWLGQPLLAFPALIIWGFPWVGTFAVLTYLARLQGIGVEIYESAEIDGANAWNKFTHVELPLILSMVRINLVFVILGTLQDVALIMLLFGGDTGGPGGVVDVPALFMYREAFSMMHFGKACAIGVVLTVIVFALSKVNEKIVRVS